MRMRERGRSRDSSTSSFKGSKGVYTGVKDFVSVNEEREFTNVSKGSKGVFTNVSKWSKGVY